MDQHTIPCNKTFSVYSALTYKSHRITIHFMAVTDTNPTRHNPIPGDVDRKPNHSFEEYVKAKMRYQNASLYTLFSLNIVGRIESDDAR